MSNTSLVLYSLSRSSSPFDDVLSSVTSRWMDVDAGKLSSRTRTVAFLNVWAPFQFVTVGFLSLSFFLLVCLLRHVVTHTGSTGGPVLTIYIMWAYVI